MTRTDNPATAVRTYVEMRERTALQRAARPGVECRIDRVDECPAAFWRFLYTEVGRPYHWVDRLPWTDEAIRTYLADPAVSLWLLTVRGAPAGYFELRGDAEGGVEVAYLGLLPEFTGRGLGAWLVGEAADTAWRMGASRVWLHTCSLDHPAALPNYLKRGFTACRTEEYPL
jgi:GNAT superfamily N-acetyltransferase